MFNQRTAPPTDPVKFPLSPATAPRTATRRAARRLPYRAFLLVLALLALAGLQGVGPSSGIRIGTVHAASGFTYTNPGLNLVTGVDSGSVLLAATAYDASINVPATSNPSVNWGDGTVDSLSFDANPLDSGSPCTSSSNLNINCRLNDHHVYNVPGTYTVTITYYTGALISYSTTTTAVVVQATGVDPLPNNFYPTAGVQFSGPIAYFTDSNTSDPASTFSATINWGDGATSSGTVGGAHGYFGISGSHTYVSAGTYAVEVQTSYGITTVDVYGTAYVTAPPTQAAGVTLSASPGSAFSGVVATFRANAPGAMPGDYNATINWGDGTGPNGQGTVMVSINGYTDGFSVTGTHTYATPGHYVTTVQITNSAGASATATGSVTVASCPSTTAPSDAYATAVLASGPLGYWRLDDASPATCVRDASGNNLTGLAGAGVAANQPGALGSDPDTALGFNGTTGYVSLGDPSALQPQQVSVEAWVNTTSTPGSLNTIVRKRGYGYDLYLNQNGTPGFNIIDSNVNVYTVTGATSVADGHWHYLVGTYNGSQVCLYVDGVAAGQCRTAGTIYYSSDMVAIGRDGGYAGNYFTGRIDEVAIYGRALSAAEAQAHYAVAVATMGLIQATGAMVTVGPGSAFSGVVATFNGPTNVPYAASINWGDGTPIGPGTVIGSSTGSAVTGTHIYATPGHYVTTVQITNSAGASATAIGGATVATCPSTTAPSDAYATAVLASGPLGYWRLDDASPATCVRDASGNNLTGLAGAGVAANQPGALGSDPDTALGFNGTTGYVSLGDPSALQPQQVSVEAWVNTTSTPGSLNTIVRKRGYGYDLYLNQNGTPRFNIIDSNVNVYTVTGATSVADGHWHYLVGTYNGSQVCLYVDGVAAGACQTAGTIYYSSDMVAIGRDGGYAGNYFAGRIDEVAIYGRVLSAAEIQGHYTAVGR